MLWKPENCGPIFKEYIDRCFDYKKASVKGTPLYEVSKLMMNGLYGKMLSKIIETIREIVSDEDSFNKFFDSNWDVKILKEIG